MSRKLIIDGPVRLKSTTIEHPIPETCREPTNGWDESPIRLTQARFTIEIDLVSSGDFIDLFLGGQKDVQRRVNNYIAEKLKEGI